jgi:hypothetical protein
MNRIRTDNTMAKRQTTQWPKDRQHKGQKTDNTMAKRQTTQWPKDRQHNGQKTDNTMAKRQTTQWPKEKLQKDKQRSTKHTYKNTLYIVLVIGYIRRFLGLNSQSCSVCT